MQESAPPPLPELPESLGFGDRSLFPSLGARHYLNYAAISPASLLVRQAVLSVVDDYMVRGVDAFPTWIAQRERLRKGLAAMIGAAPADVALTPGTTRGVISVARCIDWRSGQRVVLFEGEFPANITPWQQVAVQFGLDNVFLPLGGFVDGSGSGLARLEETLAAGRVRLVAVSAVQFQTGWRMPLRAMAALCHRYGAELFVDGIQACGSCELDVVADEIDYLVCGAHKWLMGLEGCGFAYIAPRCMARLQLREAGWLSHEDGLGFLFEGPGQLRYDRPIRRRADFLENGAYNSVGFAALEAALQPIQLLGPAAIWAHVQQIHDRLESALLDRGFRSLRPVELARRSSILSVLPPSGLSVVDLVARLGERGVAVSIPDGHLRFAPHWPTALDETHGIIAAVDAVLADPRH